MSSISTNSKQYKRNIIVNIGFENESLIVKLQMDETKTKLSRLRYLLQLVFRRMRVAQAKSKAWQTDRQF